MERRAELAHVNWPWESTRRPAARQPTIYIYGCIWLQTLKLEWSSSVQVIYFDTRQVLFGHDKSFVSVSGNLIVLTTVTRDH